MCKSMLSQATVCHCHVNFSFYYVSMCNNIQQRPQENCDYQINTCFSKTCRIPQAVGLMSQGQCVHGHFQENCNLSLRCVKTVKEKKQEKKVTH